MTGEHRSSGPLILAFLSSLAIMYVVPLPVYALMESMGFVDMPTGGTPGQFMLSVLVIKVGVALGFVFLLRLSFDVIADRWLLYAGVWWAMFAIIEIGQAIGPDYSVGDALGGIIAEAVYFPLSSWLAVKLLTPRAET